MAIDPRERFSNPEETLRVAMDGLQARLWTALPGLVQSYNSAANTVTVQPSIQGRQQRPDGAYVALPLPLLVDVPVVFQAGGDFVFTTPIAAGDEALVVFSARCIDAWWQNGGVQPEAELRTHDLSDGFAFVGPRSQPRKIVNISATSAQLRTLEGDTYIEITHGKVANIFGPNGVNLTSTGGNVNISAPAGFVNVVAADNISLQAASTNVTGNFETDLGGTGATSVINGNLQINGTVSATGEGTFGAHTVGAHYHTGVQTGGGNTGAPVG